MNVGVRRARAATVICTYYDQEGGVIATSHTYLSPSVIERGERDSFKTSSAPLKINPASHKLTVLAKRCDPSPSPRWQLLLLMAAVFAAFIVLMKRRGW